LRNLSSRLLASVLICGGLLIAGAIYTPSQPVCAGQAIWQLTLSYLFLLMDFLLFTLSPEKKSA
jgi:hypothetical protein